MRHYKPRRSIDVKNGIEMANSRAAKKRVRQNERRSIRNRARRSRVRSYLRKVEEAIASGDKAAAKGASKK